MAGSNDHSIQKNSIIQQYMLVLEHLQVRLHMFWSDVFWFVLIWAQQIKEFSEVPAKKSSWNQMYQLQDFKKQLFRDIDSFSFY